MEQSLVHYEFINAQTGNVIGYLSLPATMNENMQTEVLKKKQAEVAISNKLYIGLVYLKKKEE